MLYIMIGLVTENQTLFSFYVDEKKGSGVATNSIKRFDGKKLTNLPSSQIFGSVDWFQKDIARISTIDNTGQDG